MGRGTSFPISLLKILTNSTIYYFNFQYGMSAALQEQFWNKRNRQLTAEVELNLTSLYSWALLLKKSIGEKKQWAKDKLQITGKAFAGVPKTIHALELELAKSIINFVVDGELIVVRNEKSAVKSAVKSDKHGAKPTTRDSAVIREVSDEDEVEVELDDDVEIDEKTGKPVGKTQVVGPLQQIEDDQARLDADIARRRALLMKEQNGIFDANAYAGIINGDVPDSKVVTFSLDTTGDAFDKEGNKLKEDVRAIPARPVRRSRLLSTGNREKDAESAFDSIIAAASKRGASGVVEQDGEEQDGDVVVEEVEEIVTDNATTEPITDNNDTTVVPVATSPAVAASEAKSSPFYPTEGEMKPKLDPACYAPTITPLLRLDDQDREELYEKLYLQARENVMRHLPDEKRESILDDLINKEADRLLDVYMKSR